MHIILIVITLLLSGGVHAQTYSGHQNIQGTQVYTEIFEDEGFARFSNSCGSQTLTQRQLQQGAIPNNIIPCSDSGEISDDVYCEPGYVSSSTGGCQPIGSTDCGDGRYCSGEQICSVTGGCQPIGSTNCGDGRYCERGHICGKGNECLEIMSSRVCVDLKSYCRANYMCNGDMMCVKEDAEAVTTAEETPDEYGNYVALFSTRTGRFFGNGAGASRDEAINQARHTCIAFKRNTATTQEERAESCEVSVWIQDGCVALSRSHDRFYGAPESFSGGMATDPARQPAINESFELCKNKGGGDCFVVIESVQCSSKL